MASYEQVTGHYYGFPEKNIPRRVAYIHSALNNLRIDDEEIDDALNAVAVAIPNTGTVRTKQQFAERQLTASRLGKYGLRKLASSQLNLSNFFKQPSSATAIEARRMSASRILCGFIFGSIPISYEPVEETLPEGVRPGQLVMNLKSVSRMMKRVVVGDPTSKLPYEQALAAIDRVELSEPVVARIGMSELNPDRTLELLAAQDDARLSLHAEAVIASRYIARGMVILADRG